MRRIMPILAVLASSWLLPATIHAQDKISVKTVKYQGLAEFLRNHKGKVVLVDLWATW